MRRTHKEKKVKKSSKKQVSGSKSTSKELAVMTAIEFSLSSFVEKLGEAVLLLNQRLNAVMADIDEGNILYGVKCNAEDHSPETKGKVLYVNNQPSLKIISDHIRAFRRLFITISLIPCFDDDENQEIKGLKNVYQKFIDHIRDISECRFQNDTLEYRTNKTGSRWFSIQSIIAYANLLHNALHFLGTESKKTADAFENPIDLLHDMLRQPGDLDTFLLSIYQGYLVPVPDFCAFLHRCFSAAPDKATDFLWLWVMNDTALSHGKELSRHFSIGMLPNLLRAPAHSVSIMMLDTQQPRLRQLISKSRIAASAARELPERLVVMSHFADMPTSVSCRNPSLILDCLYKMSQSGKAHRRVSYNMPIMVLAHQIVTSKKHPHYKKLLQIEKNISEDRGASSSYRGSYNEILSVRDYPLLPLAKKSKLSTVIRDLIGASYRIVDHEFIECLPDLVRSGFFATNLGSHAQVLSGLEKGTRVDTVSLFFFKICSIDLANMSSATYDFLMFFVERVLVDIKFEEFKGSTLSYSLDKICNLFADFIRFHVPMQQDKRLSRSQLFMLYVLLDKLNSFQEILPVLYDFLGIQRKAIVEEVDGQRQIRWSDWNDLHDHLHGSSDNEKRKLGRFSEFYDKAKQYQKCWECAASLNGRSHFNFLLGNYSDCTNVNEELCRDFGRTIEGWIDRTDLDDAQVRILTLWAVETKHSEFVESINLDKLESLEPEVLRELKRIVYSYLAMNGADEVAFKAILTLAEVKGNSPNQEMLSQVSDNPALYSFAARCYLDGVLVPQNILMVGRLLDRKRRWLSEDSVEKTLAILGEDQSYQALIENLPLLTAEFVTRQEYLSHLQCIAQKKRVFFETEVEQLASFLLKPTKVRHVNRWLALTKIALGFPELVKPALYALLLQVILSESSQQRTDLLKLCLSHADEETRPIDLVHRVFVTDYKKDDSLDETQKKCLLELAALQRDCNSESLGRFIVLIVRALSPGVSFQCAIENLLIHGSSVLCRGFQRFWQDVREDFMNFAHLSIDGIVQFDLIVKHPKRLLKLLLKKAPWNTFSPAERLTAVLNLRNAIDGGLGEISMPGFYARSSSYLSSGIVSYLSKAIDYLVFDLRHDVIVDEYQRTDAINIFHFNRLLEDINNAKYAGRYNKSYSVLRLLFRKLSQQEGALFCDLLLTLDQQFESNFQRYGSLSEWQAFFRHAINLLRDADEGFKEHPRFALWAAHLVRVDLLHPEWQLFSDENVFRQIVASTQDENLMRKVALVGRHNSVVAKPSVSVLRSALADLSLFNQFRGEGGYDRLMTVLAQESNPQQHTQLLLHPRVREIVTTHLLLKFKQILINVMKCEVGRLFNELEVGHILQSTRTKMQQTYNTLIGKYYLQDRFNQITDIPSLKAFMREMLEDDDLNLTHGLMKRAYKKFAKREGSHLPKHSTPPLIEHIKDVLKLIDHPQYRYNAKDNAVELILPKEIIGQVK